jgi:predicted CXXCH cytochrome family protein
MEMKKVLKITSVVIAALAVVATISVFVNQKKADAQLPEYVGSQACLGCHSGKYERWEASGHAHMVDEVVKNSDLPADPATAPTELQAELAKATYVVAGQRFLARDQATGDLKYLNVLFDKATSKYVAYKGGSDWTTGCAGCHSTGFDTKSKTFTETGIGCEMCHGPGRDHILGKGDVSKIEANTDAVTCGQCHNGSGKNADGVTWPVGYRPGMKTLAEVGFTLTPVADPHGVVPEVGKPKLRQFAMWQASAHAPGKSITDLTTNDHASGNCYSCHSAQAAAEKKAGVTPDPKANEYTDGVSCVACHSPHGGNNYAQLKTDPKTLCESCHTASLAEGTTFKPGSEVHHPMKEMLNGYGAIGVAPTEGAHTEKSCNECHMTEGNHMMKVIKPSDVEGTTRKDTCTTCHTNSSPESREAYLDLWQESVTGKVEAGLADKAVIEAAVKVNPNALTAELKATFDAAKTNLSFIEADASKGAHNFEYAIKIATKAAKDMAAVKAALPK